MILFAKLNNSIEFRCGPSHLKMIMLGKQRFDFVQRFAAWHASTKPTIARDVFLHTESMSTINLLGRQLQPKIHSLLKRKRAVE